MTRVGIYSLLDVKSKMYGPLIAFASDEVAVRNVQEMYLSGDPASLFCKYPQDYILFCLGHYDNSDGLLIPLPAPMLVANGLELSAKALDELENRRKIAERMSSIRGFSNDNNDNNPHVTPVASSSKAKRKV